MTEGRLEVESKSQECLVIIKREVTSNNLPKRRVPSSTHGVVGGRRLATASYSIAIGILNLRQLTANRKNGVAKCCFSAIIDLQSPFYGTHVRVEYRHKHQSNKNRWIGVRI